MAAVSLGLGNMFPLAHSASILSAQITAQSVSHWPVLAPRSTPFQCYTRRGSQSLPDPEALRAQCCQSSIEDLAPV